MSPSPLEFLRHVLDECAYLIEQSAHATLDEFLQDGTMKRAFVRSIEVIGEAVKQVPDGLKACYPDVEWRAMAGMRDKVIHHYFGVDYEIVWSVAVHKAPLLHQQIAQILRDSDSASGVPSQETQ